MYQLGAFLGHFHPVLVHLPIGIFVLLAVLEAAGLLSRAKGLSWLPRLSKPQRTLILTVGAAAAVLTATLGWLLSGGDYDRALLHAHRWLGIEAAWASVFLLAVHRVRWLYAPALIASLVLLVMAGHAGGKVTHGSEYLTAQMPARLRRMLGIPVVAARPKPTDAAHAVMFADVVQPILEQRCVSCHGASKSNGELRVDSWELLAKGGKHGAVLNSSNPAMSEFLRRIDLPPDEKEHMPPRGKPQLADDDLSILEWWIGSGAPRDALASTLSAPAEVQDALDARFGGKIPEKPPYRAATLLRSAQLAARLGILIRPMSPDGPWIDVNARQAGRAFGDAQLSQLVQIEPAITWLDLGGTSVTDVGLAQVSNMRRIERLHLDGTAVTDSGLAYLSGLKHLQYLNLRGTAVTDKGLPALCSATSLRALYVWQTAVTPEALKRLGDTLVDSRKISRWKADREDLGRRIQEERFVGDTGESLRLDKAP